MRHESIPLTAKLQHFCVTERFFLRECFIRGLDALKNHRFAGRPVTRDQRAVTRGGFGCKDGGVWVRTTGPFLRQITAVEPMTETHSESCHAAPPSGLRRWLPLFVLGVGAAIGVLAFGDRLSFETLAENRDALLAHRDAHYGLTVGLFIGIYAVVVAFSLPGATVLTLTGGFLFATFPGTLINMTGATLGAVALFLAAKWGLGQSLAARLDASEGRIKRLKAAIDANQWEVLFLIRLVPAVPFFVANLLPALVGVPLSRFVITTFLGIIPGALVYTSVGAGLGDVLADGDRPDLGVIFEPRILLPILGLAVLAALPIVLKTMRRKETL